jgi:hypothetical protein
MSPTNAMRTARNGGRFLRRVIRKDVSNFIAYGFDAPRVYERIWVQPSTCKSVTTEFQWDHFGAVVGGDWDTRSVPLHHEPKFHAAVVHWRDGVSWDSTGIYEYMLDQIAESGTTDGCDSIDDVVRRYRCLDEIFDRVRRQGRLKTQAELSGLHFRQAGGVLFHIDRDSNPVFGAWGCHRLAIAVVTDLPVIPAQIGVVHHDSRDAWRDRYSRQEAQNNSGIE